MSACSGFRMPASRPSYGGFRGHAKVADYPFTTLQPHLGVVRIETDKSFVIADIPGLIEGAAEGAGLGVQFLKHVARTRLLLHMVDIAPLDGETDPVEQIRTIERELAGFDPELLKRERWLVFNKLDLLPVEEREKTAKSIVKKLKWKKPGISFRPSHARILANLPRYPALFDEQRRDAAEIAAQQQATQVGIHPDNESGCAASSVASYWVARLLSRKSG